MGVLALSNIAGVTKFVKCSGFVLRPLLFIQMNNLFIRPMKKYSCEIIIATYKSHFGDVGLINFFQLIGC